MQNKGAIIFLAIALTLVSIYQLSFTVASYKVKKEAKEYAPGDLKQEAAYLDSISSLPKDQWSFLGNTFKEVQSKEINLGLDLKGGMNVIMEVSVEDIVRALSNYSTDKTFNEAIAMAREKKKNSQRNFIELFGESFEEIDPTASLAAIFGTMDLKDKVNFNSTNAEVLQVLIDETESAIDNAFNILRSRIDRYGVTQPNISRLEARGRILIELPGVKDPQRVRDLLQGTAKLEFWETYENPDVIGYLMQANNLIAQQQKDMADLSKPEESADETAQPAEGAQASQDTTAGEESLLDLLSDSTQTAEPETREQFNIQNPLFAILSPSTDQNGQPLSSNLVGYSSARDTAKVMEYLNMTQVRALFPRDLKFLWSAEPAENDPSQSIFLLYAIKDPGKAPLDGDVVTSARVSYGQGGSNAEVDMSMNAEGAKTWARMTGSNVGKCLAVVLDGYVRSSPRVQTEIKGGNTQITGGFTIEKAEDLANILKSGKLPAPAKVVSDTVVGPSLGEEAIRAGLSSFMVAFLLVLVYMVFWYSRKAGLVADIALLVNMFFIAGVLASLGAVLTLPGIAGIVLTIGMSVDANVLIYERIKEELKSGKGVKLALSDGYRNAYSAIIDGNVTTLLTGIVLYVFGTGPIKGFATTLIIGILTSLFSAIFITRLIYEGFLKRNVVLTFATRFTENVFSKVNIDFLGKRKIAYFISGTLITIGIVSLFVKGLNPGIDFSGGRSYVVRFDKPVSTVEVADLLKKEYGEAPQVVVFGNEDQVKITTKYKINQPEAEDEVEQMLYEGLKPILGDVDADTFFNDYRQSSETVGPTIASDITVKASWAIALALIIMFLYIFIRFRNWRYGLGAVAALIHDSLIVIGLFSIGYGIFPFSMEIDQAFIAAILTVVGYSVNDTVIIFDRIREYVGLYRKRPKKEIMNMALNSTLGRTFSTSFSTLIVLFAIFIFGGEVIRGFTFAILVGIFVGTYSSLFVATPIVYDTIRRTEEAEKTPKKK